MIMSRRCKGESKKRTPGSKLIAILNNESQGAVRVLSLGIWLSFVQGYRKVHSLIINECPGSRDFACISRWGGASDLARRGNSTRATLILTLEQMNDVLHWAGNSHDLGGSRMHLIMAGALNISCKNDFKFQTWIYVLEIQSFRQE